MQISGNLHQTCGQPFLIYDNGTDAESQVIKNASQEELQELQELAELKLGSWMASRLFTQLYLIRVPVGLACQHCLCTRPSSVTKTITGNFGQVQWIPVSRFSDHSRLW